MATPTLQSIEAELNRIRGQARQVETGVRELVQARGGTVPAQRLIQPAVPVPVIPEPAPVQIEDISEQKAFFETYRADLEKMRIAELEKAGLAAQTPTALTKEFFEKLVDLPTRKEARTALIEERATETAREVAAMSEIQSLMTQYNQKEQAKESMLAAARQTVGSEAFIGRQLSKKERAANVELNNLASQIDMKMSFEEMARGQFDRAEKHLRLGLDAYNSDRRADLQDFKIFFDINKQIFDDIDEKYETIFTETIELKKAQIKEDDKRIGENWKILVKYPWFGTPTDWELMPTTELMNAVMDDPGWDKDDVDDSFAAGRKFISDNPTFSRAELKAVLLDPGEGNLNVSDANALLAEAGIIEEKTQFTQETIDEIAENLVNAYKGGFLGFFTSVEEAKKKAIEVVKNGTLNIKDKKTGKEKMINISQRQIDGIVNAINSL
jgi:hypothetical protein